MKLRHLLFGLLAGVAFAACTNDNEPAGVTPAKGADEVAAASKYMSVNFVMPGATTRTDDDEAGTDAENAINKAIFLFFKGENQVAEPFTIEGEAWKDAVSDKTQYASQTEAWTDKTKAVVVLENPTDIPTSMVVLINYTPKTAITKDNTKLKDLKDIIADFSGTTNGYVMSNSVYNDAAGNVIGAPVSAANVKETPDAARLAPVDVYVERVLAKVKVSDDADIAINSKNDSITVVLKGWGLAYENAQSYLIKKLGAKYPDFSWKWNDAENHRSYWAESAEWTAKKDEQENPVGTSYNTAADKALKTILYTQENTAFPDTLIEGKTDGNPTAVIVAAELQYGKAKEAVNLYKYLGVVYPEKEFIAQLANEVKYYKMTVTENDTTYVKLVGDDYELDTPAAGAHSYEAKMNLKLKSTTTGNFVDADLKPVTADAINTALKAAAVDVPFWNGGATYYYVPIKHHVDTDATKDVFGVVRNHYYQLNITKVTGLGTAVPNPETIIVPVTPEEEDYWIAAKITVNPWKLVSYDVELGK